MTARSVSSIEAAGGFPGAGVPTLNLVDLLGEDHENFTMRCKPDRISSLLSAALLLACASWPVSARAASWFSIAGIVDATKARNVNSTRSYTSDAKVSFGTAITLAATTTATGAAAPTTGVLANVLYK